MSDPFYVGDVLALTTRFFSPTGYDPAQGAGSLVDPAVVGLSIRNPLGTVAAPVASRVATGIYFAEQSLSLGGVWHWRWAGTGAYQGALEGHLPVASTRFP